MKNNSRGRVDEANTTYAVPPYQNTAASTGALGNTYFGGSSGGGSSGGQGQNVNYDRVYEVYRWWVDNTGGNPSRLREHPYNMGPAEWALLDQIVQQNGTNFQPAFDYRAAQKGGAGGQALSQWAPSNVGLGGWSGSPVTGAQNPSLLAGGAGLLGGVGGAGMIPGVGNTLGGVAGQLAGYQEQALQDYQNIQGQFQGFAGSGGYSDEDLSNIRARAVSPIRSIYSGARRDVDRQRSLQGGYSPNRTASLAKMAREESYTTADASTNVESAIAQMVNEGKRFGLSGMAGLYGSTPGLASTFGNQALGVGQQALGFGNLGLGQGGLNLGVGDQFLTSQGQFNQAGQNQVSNQVAAENQPGWWDTWGKSALTGAAMILPFLSDKDSKEDIKPVKFKILPKLASLPISTWKYKGDTKTHIGPMAQDFFAAFGGADDKTIDPVDVAGVTLGALKELAEAHNATN